PAGAHELLQAPLLLVSRRSAGLAWSAEHVRPQRRDRRDLPPDGGGPRGERRVLALAGSPTPGGRAARGPPWRDDARRGADGASLRAHRLTARVGRASLPIDRSEHGPRPRSEPRELLCRRAVLRLLPGETA